MSAQILRSTWTRSSQLRRALLVAAGLLLAGSVAALAFWTITVLNPGNNQAQAAAASLSAPTTPTTQVNGSGAITVGWSLPASQLVGAQYRVTRSSGPGSPATVCTVASTATSCQDSGLTANTAYGYSIMEVLANWQSSAITTSATTATPSFSIALSASPYTAGSAITVTSITAKVGGNTDTTYTGSKTITWSGLANSPSGQAPAYPSSAVTFSNGVASPSSTLTADNAGSTTLVATDSAATSVTGSVTFSVNAAGAASTAVVSGSGQSATVNTAFANALVAVVKDAYGNPVSGANVAFTAPSSGASGKFANNSTTTTASTGGNGQATSSTFTANTTAGAYNVSAAAVGTSAVNFALSNTAGSAATASVISGTPQSATVNTAYANPLVVSVVDSFGNPVSGATVTFTAPASGASGSFANNSTSTTANTGSNGQATSSTFTANTTAGSYNVSASASGTNTVNFAMTNLTGAASSIAVVSGSGQSTTVNTAFASPLVAVVTDSFSNPVSGVTVTFTSPASGASGKFANNTASTTAVTASNGRATSSTLTANTAAGAYNVSASASGTNTASFSLSNLAGAASSIAVVSGSGQSTTVNTAFANPLVAAVSDSFGNAVSGVTVTFTAPASGASGSFANSSATTTATTGSTGQATSSTFTANGTTGGYNVSASASGAGSTSFAMTNTASLSMTALSLANHGSTAGQMEQGDTVTVTFSAGLKVSSICSAWSNDAANQSNNTATVHVTGNQANNLLTISAWSACPTFHFGSIDMGSSAYVTSTGSSNKPLDFTGSTVAYNATAHTITITLGTLGTGSNEGTPQTVASSAATLTIDPGITSNSGASTSPTTFTTGTIRQF